MSRVITLIPVWPRKRPMRSAAENTTKVTAPMITA